MRLPTAKLVYLVMADLSELEPTKQEEVIAKSKLVVREDGFLVVGSENLYLTTTRKSLALAIYGIAKAEGAKVKLYTMHEQEPSKLMWF